MSRWAIPSGVVRFLPFTVAVLASLVVLFSPASVTPPTAPGVDKVVHLALFGVLTLTGAFGRLPRTRMGVGLVAYAVGSELLQGQLPIGRSSDPFDALVDVLGVVLGLLAARAVGKALC